MHHTINVHSIINENYLSKFYFSYFYQICHITKIFTIILTMKQSLRLTKSKPPAQSPNYQPFDKKSPIRPREKLPTVYRKNIQYFDNPQVTNSAYRFTKWEKPRLDDDVVKQRKQLIVSSSRVSPNAPDNFISTFRYYIRGEKQSRYHARDQEKNYNVLNQKRTISYDSPNYMSHHSYIEKRKPSDNSMLGYQTESQYSSIDSRSNKLRMFSALNWQKQVTPKVGSLNQRDYTIRKPLLKIGKEDHIDTYSPF